MFSVISLSESCIALNDFAKVPISSFLFKNLSVTSLVKSKAAIVSAYLTATIIGLANELPIKKLIIIPIIKIINAIVIIDICNLGIAANTSFLSTVAEIIQFVPSTGV
jgi:hypothetical protein